MKKKKEEGKGLDKIINYRVPQADSFGLLSSVS